MMLNTVLQRLRMYLDATEPSGPGSGTWTVISGAATFSDINDANATASNLGIGENILQWTIDNGPCSSTGEFDQVSITIYDETTPDADAGDDQERCIDDIIGVVLNATAVNAPSLRLVVGNSRRGIAYRRQRRSYRCHRTHRRRKHLRVDS